MTTGAFTPQSQPKRDGSIVRARQARSPSTAGSYGHVARTLAVLLIGIMASSEVAHAVPLDQLIPGLFGGTLITTTKRSQSGQGLAESQRLRFQSQFNSLSADLSAAHSQVPIPSASGAFRFAWDPDLDTFVRSTESLGSLVAERAPTLGRYTGFFSFTYTHIDYDTLDGNSLSNLTFSQSAFSQALINTGLFPKDEVIRSQLNLGLTFDTFFFSGAFGLTDTIDVSMALSVSQAKMTANIVSRLQKTGGQQATSYFLDTPNDHHLVAKSGTLCGFPQAPNAQCATDGFSETAFGTGDLFLRGKWHFYDTKYADLAAVGVLTLPTGNADDFLGFHDPTFTPWLIASKDFGRVSPHINLGYALRSGADVSQAEFVTGADIRAAKWLTLAGDILGYFDDKRDGINDNVLQSAVGFKVNPFGKFVIGGNFQFPLNREGLRADVIYTGQVEYTY